MAPERDYQAERFARIKLLIVEVRQTVGTVALDRSVSESLRTRLGDALKELGLESIRPTGTTSVILDDSRRNSNGDGDMRRRVA